MYAETNKRIFFYRYLENNFRVTLSSISMQNDSL